MALTSEFYRARAAESAREAREATLANVRERCERSEAVWLSIAERAAAGEEMRDSLAAEKATRAEKASQEA